MLITGEMRLVEFDDGFGAARASDGDFLFPAVVLQFRLKAHNSSYRSLIGVVHNNSPKISCA